VRWFRRGESASTLDLLVVGLGNPGREYAETRHNVGFMVADELVRRTGGSWRGKFSGELAEVRLDGKRLALLRPQTFMNESGRSVAAAVRFFKVEPGDLLVVHDEVDLEPGRLQVRLGGGRAGRGDPRPVADYVLSEFPPELDVGALVSRAADAVGAVARDGLEEAQNRYNERA
jgi:PTH1 family peptidyl-tRNA hydrolase